MPVNRTDVSRQQHYHPDQCRSFEQSNAQWTPQEADREGANAASVS
jgi:hypothetical protein